MQVNPYLMFDGQCEAAFKFYHQVLGGELGDMMTFAGSPAEAEVPPEFANKIMHTQLTFGDWAIMGSDCPLLSTMRPKASQFLCKLPIPTKPSTSFKPWLKVAPFKCPSKKPSGRSGLVWQSINLAFPG